MHFLMFIVIGLIAGALAGRVVSGHGYGVMGDIVIGITGAFLGGWLFSGSLGVVGSGLLVSLASACFGAVVLLWAIRMVVPARA